MSYSPIAILDLGSNTFHIVITSYDQDQGLQVIYRERVYTKLSLGGGSNIMASSFQKGIETLVHFRSIIDKYQIQTIKALGTASLRDAQNGPLFIAEALEKAMIKIEIIDGHQEAAFIQQGVQYAIGKLEEQALIMDIGGGSVEFILYKGKHIEWKESYRIGLGILKSKFHRTDPIPNDEILEIFEYLDKKLLSFTEQLLKTNAPKFLIGASGSFEVLQVLLQLPRWTEHSYKMSIEDFEKIYNELILLNLKARIAYPGVPKERADLIVLALILMQWVLQKTKIQEICISDYALKEGVAVGHFSIFR